MITKTKIIILTSICFYCTNIFAQIKCSDNYYQKRGLMYLGEDTIPFNGVYRDYFPGKVKTMAHYKNGILNGEYRKYNEFGELEFLMNYKNGIRHGISEEYINYAYSSYLISKEYFNMGNLDSGFYWSNAGIIKKIERNSVKKEVLLFPVDSGIFRLIPWMGIEKTNWSGADVILKNNFYNHDSIKINIAKITCRDCYTEEPTGWDTISLENYKIKSFIFTPLANGIDMDFFSKKGYIPKTMISRCKELNVSTFYLSDIKITDYLGIEYELPSFKYELK